MTIQQLYQEFLADRKSNAQRTAEIDRNIKQSEARIDKICVGLLTIQAEQKEAMNINNEQMGAISQQLLQSEDRIDHKASAPGALTGLPQQQADSTDRSRKGQRKPKRRGNSSSSDSSLEREFTRWQENSGARDRSRSPRLPKMQIFNGRGSMTWEAFIYQFERTAGRRQWENRKKGLKKSIEAALQHESRSDQIGTEAFLRGFKNKESARHVIERNPETINKALKQLKTPIANQMAIYG
ncbi:unnamed protein product [Mytilus coruscus]|uniref:Uncharacterized protein n=1 Tax=Mytilus coruscus TaxID=42192 RepID=A0A6J8E3S2_MYTCO|nr:unnamed protein product [Mytilus coruscus]